MEHYFTHSIAYFDQYGYWFVFGFLMLETFGLPVPGESLLILGTLLASQGKMNIMILFLIGWIAAVAGDNIGYAIGRFGGRHLVLKYGRYVFINKYKLNIVEKFFQKYGLPVVIFARFFAVLRQLNGIFAGIAQMSWKRFVLYNVCGSALWVGFWCWFAYNFAQSLIWIKPFFITSLPIIVIIIVIFQLIKKRRGKKHDNYIND